MALRFLQAVYLRATNRVKWQGEMSSEYPVQKCARQGDPCSGILFDLYLDQMSDAIANGRQTEVRLGSREVFILKFADDAVIASDSESELQNSVERVVQFSENMLLPINLKKTVCVVNSGRSDQKQVISIQISGHKLKHVLEFCYLGVIINERLDFCASANIQQRKVTAHSTLFCEN